MECGICPLRDMVRVDPEGSIEECEVVIVGEAPGAEEERQGRPFVGRSGKLLRGILHQLGMDGSRVYITNVVKCRPPRNELTKEMVKCCSPLLEIELLKLKGKSKLIVALGKVAKEFFNIPGSMEDVRGKVFETKYGKVLVTWHPAYLLRRMWEDRVLKVSPVVFFAKDLIFGKKIVEVGKTFETVQYELVDNEEKGRRVLEEVDGKVCAFDFETYMMDPWNPGFKALTCALSIGVGKNWVVDFERWKGAKDFLAEAFRITKPLFFNSVFDLSVGNVVCGWDVYKEVEDLQVITHLLYGGGGKGISLKRLALDWTDVGDYGLDFRKSEDILKVPREKLWMYNATDAEVTLRVFGILKEKLKDDLEWSDVFGGWKRDLEWAYENVLKKLIRMAVNLKVSGIKVDVDYLRSLEGELMERKRELQERIGAGINLNSPQQVMRWLRSKGIEVSSTRREEIEKLLDMGGGEELRMLMEYRTIEKLLNTYVVPLRMEQGVDGLIHATFSVVGSETGRLSCKEPNLMNIPTRLGPLVEKAFVSRFGEDGVMLKADFSQHELRVACQYSKDRKMKEFFESGVDIHTKVAMEIYGLKEEELGTEKEKKLRRVAKGFNFGVIYGRGAKSIAEELGLSEDEGRKMIEDYFAMFRELKEWLDVVKVFARNYGFVRSMFGRIRWVGSDENWAQKAVNTPVQSAASDIAAMVVWGVMEELRKRGMRSVVVNFIHDAMLIDCPKEEVEEVKSIILDEVRNIELPDERYIDFEVDIEVGRSWGEAIEEE